MGDMVNAENRKVFMSLYNAFREKHKPQQTATKEYVQGKRFVLMVDRRKYEVNGKAKDRVWFYEPPKNCRDIPSDAVSEWYLNAARTCLLPPANPECYTNEIKDRGKAL